LGKEMKPRAKNCVGCKDYRGLPESDQKGKTKRSKTKKQCERPNSPVYGFEISVETAKRQAMCSKDGPDTYVSEEQEKLSKLSLSVPEAVEGQTELFSEEE
jgi:hypothetical protein